MGFIQPHACSVLSHGNLKCVSTFFLQTFGILCLRACTKIKGCCMLYKSSVRFLLGRSAQSWSMRPITIFHALSCFLSSRMCEVSGIVPNPGLRASNTDNLIYTACAFSISAQYYFFLFFMDAQQRWCIYLLFAFSFLFLKRVIHDVSPTILKMFTLR